VAPGSSDIHGWRKVLAGLPYGTLLADEWAQRGPDHERGAVDDLLLHYAVSRDESLPKAARYAALEASYQGFRQLCQTQPTHLRLSNLARVALDYGARSVGVKALEQLCNMILERQGQVSTSEPFLAPEARFESLSPRGRQSVPAWMTAATFETLERNQYLSSYFSGKKERWRLEMIRDLGFGSDEMQRRLTLIQRRFGA
jgi:hypothetical protein